ncbi:MAG: cysteine--tRNA ligase [Candidatus Omnitrophica bacterium]|nr:cysteine--tRNA ligase [Candidatus Omnitrophota bacterium]
MSLFLYNSLTRKKEPLEKYTPHRKFGMYVCGPTVYDESHIGHARSAFTFDLLHRYLTHRGHEVTFVRNVTDVDDKIIDRARKEGGDLKTAVRAVSERYLSLYHEEMARLGLKVPTEEPKATEYIRSMQEMIEEILKRKAAYVSGCDVYFDVKQAKDYGKLSRRNPEEMIEGTRGEISGNKRDPLDFALWKGAKPEEPSWESPWGSGRPGWHIECSTMSTEIFNKRKVPFVIHGGGLDLIFPHHENEIAQAEGAGRPFASLWVHNGLVTVSGQKMSKSLGNFITLRELFERASPEVIRFYFLQTHYRSPFDFSWEKLEEARRSYEGFEIFFAKKPPLPGGHASPPERFLEAMDDDLNTPQALSVVHDMLTECNKGSGDPPRLAEALEILSVRPKPKREKLDAEIEKKIVERDMARKEGDFKQADRIRKELLEQGIILEDEKGKTTWRRAR